MIKILAVDDEPGICNFIRVAFTPLGFIVLTATNGKEALEIVRKEKPGLVFLDIKMFGMSGLEVLKEIKNMDKTTRVVMLTALTDADTKAKAIALGADDFVTKPFMTDHLEEVARKEITELFKTRQIEKPKVLIVDDEEDAREHLARLVERSFSCQVDKASSGEEALEKLKSVNFDLVVIDIKMPGLSGIDVIKQTMKFSPKMQFLAVSGYDSEEVADEALKAGAVDFLHKPQSAEGMKQKVKGILKKIGKYEPKIY